MTTNTFNPLLDIQRLHELAAKNIFIGTSSWKYEGWLDQIYSKEEFMKFGKGGKMLTLNKSKFNANSLESFSKVFPTVCYDGAYYQVPNTKTLETLESQVPDDFKMTFKCTEKFTQRRHDVKKGGDGSLNSSYLRPERFGEEYLAPIQDIFKSKLGTIIFEFSPFFFE